MKLNIYVVVYLVVIVAANLLVNHFGPSAVIYIAFVFIGLDLSLRDSLHDSWEHQYLVWKMAALIASGSIITIVLNWQALQIAIASSAAFGVAAVGDALLYQVLRKRVFLVRSNGSNVVGAALDSIIFPTIAFGALMPEIVAGQFAAKVVGGAIWSLVILRIREKRHSNSI